VRAHFSVEKHAINLKIESALLHIDELYLQRSGYEFDSDGAPFKIYSARSIAVVVATSSSWTPRILSRATR
jgi:hypothetical protein